MPIWMSRHPPVLRLALAALISLLAMGLVFFLLPGFIKAALISGLGIFLALLFYSWLLGRFESRAAGEADSISSASLSVGVSDLLQQIQSVLTEDRLLEMLDEFFATHLKLGNVRYFLSGEFQQARTESGHLFARGGGRVLDCPPAVA